MPIPAGMDTVYGLSLESQSPLTDNFSYKLGDNGVVLNPDSTTLPFVDIEKITGLDNAPYRTTERQHEGVDGGFMDAEFEKGRSVILEGTVYGNAEQIEPFLDALKFNYAPSRTLIPFYFKKPGVEERFLRVKPLGCRYDVQTIRRVGQTDIQFSMFAEDPRIYSSILHDENIQQEPIIIGGRSYDKGYSYGYGVAVDPSGANVLVGGNRPTPAIMTIFGPSSFPKIINETLGKTMEFDIILGSGETLTIDSQYHTIRLNGAENRRSTLINPSWFSLMPGNNYIRYQSAASGNSILNIQYNNAWR